MSLLGRSRVQQLEQKVASLHRSVLEKDVLRGALPMRAKTLAFRSEAPEARDREARFRACSRAYVREFASLDPDERTRTIILDSLTWWVPLLRPEDPAAVDRALRHQDFPYRVIAQTRELALGGVMLDIGANTGRMSVPRVVLGDVTAAYCAEPDPLNYRCLVRNVRDNHLTGLVLPDNLAIGAEDGIVRLERGKSTGGHRVIDSQLPTARAVLDVPGLTLDTWVERLGLDCRQVVFVKVDVQGSEVHVLRGATKLLAHRHVTWQMEVDLQALAGRGVPAAALYGLLIAHFSHFIDLSRRAEGPRVRPIRDIEAALAYLQGGADGRTDVLLFTLDSIQATPHAPLPSS